MTGDTTDRLESLVNIGPKLAADLHAAAGLHDCAHARRAIEGALAGVRWNARS